MSRTTLWFQRERQADTAGAPSTTCGRPRRRERNRFRPLILPLEDRRLLATTFSVMSTADTVVGGVPMTGTLRWAVESADSDTTSSTISFNLPSGPQTITLVNGPLVLSNKPDATTITGPGANELSVSGNQKSTVFSVETGVTATLSGLTIAGGSTAQLGGGLYNGGTVTLSGCTISGNSALAGGGVENTSSGTMTLAGCTISGNSVTATGGGVNSGGTLTLTDCTISGNSAAHDGGAVYSVDGTADLTDCTISGNLATGSSHYAHSDGSALFNTSSNGKSSTVTLISCTISGNTATFNGDGYAVYTASGATSNLEDTIVAGDSGGETGGTGTTRAGAADHDLVQATAPGLGSLGNYGGPTETIPLLPGSSALDIGAAGSGVPTTDERGEPRFGPTDIGAFESQGFTLAPVSGSTSQATPVGQPFAAALTVTVTANNSVEPVSGGTVTFKAPSTGASATLVPPQPFVISANGQISDDATANGIGGSYDVTVSPGGSETGTSLALTNQVQPVFSSLTQTSIVYGSAAPLTIGGIIQAGTIAPTGDVEITLHGVTESATIGSGDGFSAVFDVADLPVSSSPDTISYTYAANGDLLAAAGSSTLTVSPAPLTITAKDASVVYGAALPSFSASYSGFVNGDTAASLTTQPKLTTTANAASPVVAGGYPINGAGAIDGNYTIAYVAGTLTVTPAPLTITANNASTVYGKALTFFSATYVGFANGDTPASLTTLPKLTTTAASPVLAGGYPIDGAGAVDGNYTITYVAGTLTVTPAPLTITANDASTVYGKALPSFSATCAGFVNGDTPASLTTQPKLTTTANAASPVVAGGYPIWVSGAIDGNYAIAYAAGTLTVTRATPSLSVSASGGTFDGSPFPASVNVGGSGGGNAPATSLEDVAPTLVYYVGSGADYSAAQTAPVTFTIDRGTAAVGLSASAGSTVYGQPVTFTATVSGGVTTGTVTFSEGGTTLGSVAFSGSGTATLTTSALGIGSQSIAASYSGGADFTGATSGPEGVSVARAATQVVLVPNARFKKKKVVSLGLEAEITPLAPGGGLPTGMVTFEVRKTKKKETILGTLSLAGGEATLAVKPNSVLKKSITILYSGGADFQATSTTLTLTPGSLTSTARPLVRLPRRR
jgi:predicted outer membrane repeat protein